MTSHDYARKLLSVPAFEVGDPSDLHSDEVLMHTLGLQGDMVNALAAQRQALVDLFIEPEMEDEEDVLEGQEQAPTGRWKAVRDVEGVAEEAACDVFETREAAERSILRAVAESVPIWNVALPGG